MAKEEEYDIAIEQGYPRDASFGLAVDDKAALTNDGRGNFWRDGGVWRTEAGFIASDFDIPKTNHFVDKRASELLQKSNYSPQLRFFSHSEHPGTTEFPTLLLQRILLAFDPAKPRPACRPRLSAAERPAGEWRGLMPPLGDFGRQV